MRPVPGAPRFSPGVAAATWAAALAASYALILLVLSVSGNLGTARDDLPPWTTAVVVSATWVPQLVGLRYVSRHLGTGSFRDDYGFNFLTIDGIGVPIGVLSQLVLLELLYWPLRELFPDQFDRSSIEEPSRALFDRVDGGWQILLIVIVVVGAPVIEELMYRGLILRSLDGRIDNTLAILASALWFAVVHFQAVQLPGLFLFGVVLALCAQRTARLGMSIVAHAAFNATAVVMLLT